MRTRKFALKRKLLGLATGAVTLHTLWLSNGCSSNAARAGFLTAVGDGVIDTVADSAGNVGGDFNAIVVGPATGYLHDLWASYVNLRIPDDPIYQNELLVR